MSDQYMIKFHILLRVGKPRNTEHMLTPFYKETYIEMGILEKLQGLGEKKSK